jgi:hypothetical protein
MQPARVYVTTSLPYVNAPPHVGHALEFVQADAFARFHRLRGADTWFLTGPDDNSLSNILAAEREGIGVQELVDRNADRFAEVMAALAVSYDDFIRTSRDERHIRGARKFWEACARAGDIYRRAYRDLGPHRLRQPVRRGHGALAPGTGRASGRCRRRPAAGHDALQPGRGGACGHGGAAAIPAGHERGHGRAARGGPGERAHGGVELGGLAAGTATRPGQALFPKAGLTPAQDLRRASR